MSEIIKTGVLRDKNGVGVEFTPAAHKHEKIDVMGLITDMAEINSALGDLQTELDETLDALANADSSDATVAALTTQVSQLKTKFNNVAEDMAFLQTELDELELFNVEYIYKMVIRLNHVERQLGIKNLGADVGYDFSLELDDQYDEMFGQT